jgi:outer membrane protein with beta-barrel domain
MKKLALLLGLTLAAQTALQAQTGYPGADVFSGFSYMNADGGGGPRQNFVGWQAGFGGNFTRSLGIVGDFGGQYKSISGVSVSLYQYLAGPQMNFHFPGSTAFVHALVGGASARGSYGGLSASSSGFALGLGGGLDVGVSKRFAVRVFQVDYVPAHLSGSWQSNIRIGVGITARLSTRLVH